MYIYIYWDASGSVHGGHLIPLLRISRLHLNWLDGTNLVLHPYIFKGWVNWEAQCRSAVAIPSFEISVLNKQLCRSFNHQPVRLRWISFKELGSRPCSLLVNVPEQRSQKALQHDATTTIHTITVLASAWMLASWVILWLRLLKPNCSYTLFNAF